MHPIPSLSVLSLRGPPGGAGSGFEPTVASLSGELDLSIRGDLCETLAALIAYGDADLILDLSAVEFLDASAAGVLFRAEEFLAARSRCRRAAISAGVCSARAECVWPVGPRRAQWSRFVGGAW